jgi:hypothetical protein
MTTGDKLVSGGSIVAIISVFLPWYGTPSFSILGETVSGGISISLLDGRGGLAFLIIIAAAIALAAIVLRTLDVFDLSDQNLPEPIVVLAAAGVAGLFALYALIDTDGAVRKWGMWVGLVGVVIFVVGALMKFQDERA